MNLKAHPEVWMEDRHDMVDVAMTDGTSIPIDLAPSGRQQCFSLLSLPVSHCISPLGCCYTGVQGIQK